ncbi:hypothetical protein DFJ63DRAFT_312062 [Scheffersomyces coipomensis]|uniref:uncharacterized protein n=1 Tax=Scheffersomyces coipomensis TaxID=1788519 RepID=UPI00315DAB20
MRHDNSSKQTLKSSDLPPDIPAITFASDLAHIVESYRPGNHNISDIPEEIPVFNRQTGKIKQFLKKRSRSLHKKRVTSMPIINVNQTNHVDVVKELPQVPPKPIGREERRSISMSNPYAQEYPNYNYNSILQSYDSGSESESEEGEIEEENSIQFKQPPRFMRTNDEGDESSVFSNPASSIYSSHSSNLSHGSNSESIIAKSILDVVHGYSSPTVTSDKSSILSRNFDLDNIYSSPISDIGLSSHDEIGSFVDSLFSDLSHIRNGDFEIPPPPPPHTVPIITPTISYNTSTTPYTPPTPIIDSFPPPMPQKELPKKPIYTPQLRIPKSRPQKYGTTMTPAISNSQPTIHSSVSFKDDPKAEIKAYVRQRPFSYSLDGPKQYKLSRFPSMGHKKVHRLASGSTSIPTPLPKDDFQPRRIMSEQIIPNARYQTSQLEIKPKPRNVSSKQDVIKSHIHQFVMNEKRKEIVNGKNLPRVPSERENRFGKRGGHY